MRRWHRVIGWVASLYPVSLLMVAGALRYVGEKWWVTGVTLYLPRLLFAAPLFLIAITLAMVAPLRRLLWTQAVAFLILIFPLMGFVLPWPALRVRDAPVLRILSYNINSGAGGVSNIVDEIDRYSPDIVALQEVVRNSEAISDLLGTHYPTVNATGQFLLATRYPVASVSNPEQIDFGGRLRSPRFTQQILETPLGRIALYNVHPISPRDVFYSIHGQGFRREIRSGRLFASGNASIFQVNSGLRTLQVQAFAEAAQRETDSVLIAGDTNLADLSFVFHHYLSGYQDGFAKVGWGFGYTFPTNRGPWLRLDRILASEQLRFVRFDVGTSRSSDHRCVVADLQRWSP